MSAQSRAAAVQGSHETERENKKQKEVTIKLLPLHLLHPHKPVFHTSSKSSNVSSPSDDFPAASINDSETFSSWNDHGEAELEVGLQDDRIL